MKRREVPGLSLKERHLIYLVFDLLALNVGLLLGLSLRFSLPFGPGLLLGNPHWFLLFCFLWILWAHAFDAYGPGAEAEFKGFLKRAVTAYLVAFGLFILIPYISPPLPSRRSYLFLEFLIPLVFLVSQRSLVWFLFGHPRFKKKVLILGTGLSARTIAQLLAAHSRHFELLGFIKEGPSMEGDLPQLPLLGDRKAILELVARGEADTLVLAFGGEPDGELLQILVDCLSLGAEVIPMASLYERLTGRVAVEFVDGMWHVAMPFDHPLTKPINRAVKRMMDVALAAFGLAFFLPLLPLLALAIYLDSPGPIFYTQWRVGRGGRPFKLYKLRTMVPDAERHGPQWAQKGDPRVTRVGRLLRKTHLDEFPQLFNILKGEMSVVGPRPERPEFVRELTQEIPFFPLRHAAKPGMAGWGLVKYGYAASKEDSLIKLQYDLYYIKHWSLWLDLLILAKTIIDTVTFRGR